MRADGLRRGVVLFQRALQIDSGCALAHVGTAEAHTLQGWLRYWCDRDWRGAEASFRRAIALNPSSVLASFGLSFMLVVVGRCDEGLERVRTARELDPMSLLVCTMEASFLFCIGLRAEAASRLSRVLEIAPRFWIAASRCRTHAPSA